MLDYAIRNGLVVDGTGSPPRRADVGIRNGLIVAFGELEDSAAVSVDASDLVLAPGFVDPHTHYDAQLHWDPLATPSSWYGVTTVIGGNCGFTLAPLRGEDADYTRRMMAQVEGMPLEALEAGVKWSWETFGEFLQSLDHPLGVNAGFMVGHCALRRFVLGADFQRESRPDELEELERLLDDSIRAGAFGLSTSRSSTHIDGDGDPVPSRWASEEEAIVLSRVVGRHDGTSLEVMTQGCIAGFTEDEIELLARMSSEALRPLNWNILTISAGKGEHVQHQLLPSLRARELGGRVVALTLPVAADNSMSFLLFTGLWLIPGWRDILSVDVPERIRRLRDRNVRAKMIQSAASSSMGKVLRFERFVVGEVFCEQNSPYRDRLVGDIAAERGQEPLEALFDIVIADRLRTVLWPGSAGDGPEDWEARRQLWEKPDILLGGSDAGAHLDHMLGSPYPTRFLADVLRGRQLLSLPRAVQLMTSIPADLFGLSGRGRVAVGAKADLVLFDPATVDAGPVRTAFDLPQNAQRLVADPIGVHRVFVNGVETLVDGIPTGALGGRILRSGRDTTGTDTRVRM